MSATSRIEWTEATWNPVTGCTKVSPGCVNCYAEQMAKRLQAMGQPRYANGFQVTTHEDVLDEPLRWKRPRRVFVCSMGDLFHEAVPFSFINEAWHVMGQCPQHTFLLLTKRPWRMVEWYNERRVEMPLAHVCFGATVTDQLEWDNNLRWLLRLPPYHRLFISCEPLLAPIFEPARIHHLRQIIIGCESGLHRRPCELGWVKSLISEARSVNVSVFVKQLAIGGKVSKDPAEWPKWARVRQLIDEVRS